MNAHARGNDGVAVKIPIISIKIEFPILVGGYLSSAGEGSQVVVRRFFT